MPRGHAEPRSGRGWPEEAWPPYRLPYNWEIIPAGGRRQRWLHPVPGTNISPQASCPPAAPLRHLAGKTRPSSPQAQGHLFGLEDDRVTTKDVSLELLHLGGLWCKTRCCVTAQRRGISLSFPLPHAHYWQHLSVSNTSAHI